MNDELKVVMVRFWKLEIMRKIVRFKGFLIELNVMNKMIGKILRLLK